MALRGVQWRGSVGFGLVSVPVAIVPLLRSTRSSFHLVHAPDRSRLRRQMFCPEDEVFVHPEHIVRGYEYETGKHLVLRDSEIKALSPKRSQAIEIAEFVPRAALLPAHIERPYYLVPTGAKKPYQLLVEVLAEKEVVGLSEFVMHARQRFCAVLSIEGALCLLILRYAAELRPGDELQAAATADAGLVQQMQQAITSLEAPFATATLVDRYQQRIDKLIASKERKKEAVEVYEDVDAEDEEGEDAGEEVDLVAALAESLGRERL